VAREKYQTRLDPDDARAVDDFADEREVSTSEALRRLVQTGLDHHDDPTEAVIADGGETADRLDRIEEQQEWNGRVGIYQWIGNLAGLAYILAFLTGEITGLVALALAAPVLLLVILPLAASVRRNGWWFQ
jgi:hypothetical protein